MCVGMTSAMTCNFKYLSNILKIYVSFPIKGSFYNKKDYPQVGNIQQFPKFPEQDVTENVPLGQIMCPISESTIWSYWVKG